MKKLLLLLLFMGFVSNGIYAQPRQRTVLLQQITALKVYIDAAQKGYSIAKKGLQTVGDLKRGEFNLHLVYLNSLKKVNPKIKNYARVAEIIDLQWKIIKDYKRLFSDSSEGDLFHGNELDYIKRVLDRLATSCNNTLDDLIEVTTDAEFEMKDDERIKRIDKLYDTMKDDYSFFQHFKQEIEILYLSRARENRNVQLVNRLYGILKD